MLVYFVVYFLLGCVVLGSGFASKDALLTANLLLSVSLLVSLIFLVKTMLLVDIDLPWYFVLCAYFVGFLAAGFVTLVTWTVDATTTFAIFSTMALMFASILFLVQQLSYRTLNKKIVADNVVTGVMMFTAHVPLLTLSLYAFAK